MPGQRARDHPVDFGVIFRCGEKFLPSSHFIFGKSGSVVIRFDTFAIFLFREFIDLLPESGIDFSAEIFFLQRFNGQRRFEAGGEIFILFVGNVSGNHFGNDQGNMEKYCQGKKNFHPQSENCLETAFA